MKQQKWMCPVMLVENTSENIFLKYKNVLILLKPHMTVHNHMSPSFCWCILWMSPSWQKHHASVPDETGRCSMGLSTFPLHVLLGHRCPKSALASIKNLEIGMKVWFYGTRLSKHKVLSLKPSTIKKKKCWHHGYFAHKLKLSLH
jgi:hypothetical protein